MFPGLSECRVIQTKMHMQEIAIEMIDSIAKALKQTQIDEKESSKSEEEQ